MTLDPPQPVQPIAYRRAAVNRHRQYTFRGLISFTLPAAVYVGVALTPPILAQRGYVFPELNTLGLFGIYAPMLALLVLLLVQWIFRPAPWWLFAVLTAAVCATAMANAHWLGLISASV